MSYMENPPINGRYASQHDVSRGQKPSLKKNQDIYAKLKKKMLLKVKIITE